MPIRFRCSHCDRLLGIARRKAGVQIHCPQCGETVTVPQQDQGEAEVSAIDRTIRDLDDLLGPAPGANGALFAPPAPLITVDASQVPPPAPSYPVASPRPAHKPNRPKPKEDSLFEQDVDALLGLDRLEEAIVLDDHAKARPVSGADALSLDDGTGTIVLSSQKATLLVVAAAVLMLIAFVLGFAIRSTL
jgi:phage FluMu protein Com